jgi:hypothetical protein
MKKNIFFLLLFSLGLCVNLKAQSLSTEIPVRKQFVENKIQGANYAQPKQANAPKSKGFEGSSLAKQIKEGKEEGMKYNLSTKDSPKSLTGINAEKPGASAGNMITGDAVVSKEKNQDGTSAKIPEASHQEEKKQ